MSILLFKKSSQSAGFFDLSFDCAAFGAAAGEFEILLDSNSVLSARAPCLVVGELSLSCFGISKAGGITEDLVLELDFSGHGAGAFEGELELDCAASGTASSMLTGGDECYLELVSAAAGGGLFSGNLGLACDSAASIAFPAQSSNILELICRASCHSGMSASGSLRFDAQASIISGARASGSLRLRSFAHCGCAGGEGCFRLRFEAKAHMADYRPDAIRAAGFLEFECKGAGRGNFDQVLRYA